MESLERKYSFDIVFAQSILAKWKKDGYKLIFVEGVFDDFHQGHQAFFEYLRKKLERKFGNKFKLIVAVETDLKVEDKKGNFPQKHTGERLKDIINSNLVDYAFSYSRQTRYLIEDLKELQIDYLVVPDEYILYLPLFKKIKNLLKKNGINIVLSRHKQYSRYGINPDLAKNHSSDVQKLSLGLKLKKKLSSIIYLAKETLYLLFKEKGKF